MGYFFFVTFRVKDLAVTAFVPYFDVCVSLSVSVKLLATSSSLDFVLTPTKLDNTHYKKYPIFIQNRFITNIENITNFTVIFIIRMGCEVLFSILHRAVAKRVSERGLRDPNRNKMWL